MEYPTQTSPPRPVAPLAILIALSLAGMTSASRGAPPLTMSAAGPGGGWVPDLTAIGSRSGPGIGFGAAIVLLIVMYVFGVFHGVMYRRFFSWALGRRKSESPKLNIQTEWMSEYRTDVDSAGTINNWVKEKVRFSKKDSGYTFKTFENSTGREYEGSFEFFGTNYLHGSWHQAGNINNKGVFFGILSMHEDYIYGYFLGKGESEREEFAPWVFAMNPASLAKARERVKDPNLQFRSSKPLSKFRDVFHAYHQTQMDDARIWRHHEIDFSMAGNNELLVASVTVMDKENNPVDYVVEAGVISPHLVMIWRRSDPDIAEAPSIWIFPFLESKNETSYYGTIFGHNWNMDRHFGKVILSKNPYLSISETGNVNEKSEKILDRHWTEKFSRFNTVPEDLFTIAGTPVTDGINGIYLEVEKQLKFRKPGSGTLEIDILGYTLFSVEPKLNDWFHKGYLKDMRINLLHLDSDFIIDNKNIIPKSWAEDVKTSLRKIEDFEKRNSAHLSANAVSIRKFPYKHIPVVHGFRFMNIAHFISISSLEPNSNFIQLPTNDIFMRVEEGNESLQSIFMKRLFDNWADSIKRRKRGIQP